MADKSLLNILRIRAMDEEVWRTINNAKVLIDGDDGTIKGGMGGKWNGKKFKPSWGKNLKTGKKVLKPWKGKFTHFQGTKKDLLEKLKKAAEPPKKHYKEVYEEYNELGKLNYAMSKANTMEELDAAYKAWQDKFEEYKKSYADLDTDAMNHDDMTNSLAEYVLLQKNHLGQLEKGGKEDYEAVTKVVKTKECTQKAKDAWVKVVKAKNALKDAKSLKAKLGNQKKITDAFQEYMDAVQSSPGKIDFKPKTDIVGKIINMQPDELANFGHKKKGENPPPAPPPGGEGYEDPGKYDPFITPKTEPGFTDRQVNIQNTIATLKKLAEAAKSVKNKYQANQFAHQGKAGWQKTKLPAKSDAMDVHKQYVGESSRVWTKATPEEKEAIREYTWSPSKFNEPLRGIEYGSSKFKGVGNIDMDNIGVTTSYGDLKPGEAKKMINKMTDIIDKSSYNYDVHVRRGVSTSGAAKMLGIDTGLLDELIWDYSDQKLSGVKDAVEGKLCTEFGFASCGVAEGKGFTSEPVELRILCPAGTKMMYAEPFSHYGNGASGENDDWDGVDNQTSVSGEQEMILQRNTRFQVQRVEMMAGKPCFYLQVVAQDPVQFA